MASIRETRKKLMPVVIALAVLDLACIGYLLSPAGRSRQARQREYCGSASATGGQAAGSAADARHGPEAEAGVEGHQRLLRHAFSGEYSAVAEELGKVAQDTGVHLAV